MVLLNQTGFAIGGCLVAMLCWGSWSNGQKLATRNEVPVTLFYRDYVLGIALWAVLAAATLGSLGSEGLSVLADVRQATWGPLGLAFAAGIVFNLGNQLLVASIQAAGLSIAMPVGSGLALALGLVINYVAKPQGKLGLLVAGGSVVLASIACSAVAYAKKDQAADQGGAAGTSTRRGLLLAGGAGLANGFFFWLVTTSLATDFTRPEAGTLTPYTALLVFTLGMIVSNPLFEQVLRRFADKPAAARVGYGEVAARHHYVGLGSGVLWGVGMSALLLASPKAGSAISFGLSQGATIVAVLWGLVAWQEFEGASSVARRWLWAMGVSYVLGVGLIVAARLG